MLFSARMQGFDTPNEVLKAIDDGVANGRFKPCSHLAYTLRGSDFEVIQLYYPVCAKNCFASANPWNQELGCPMDCRLYVNREIATAAQNDIARLD